MEKYNARNYTLSVARDIEKVLKLLRELHLKNSNLIQVLNNEQIFYFQDKLHNDFYFFISDPQRDIGAKKTGFSITFAPQDEEYSNCVTYFSDLEGIVKYFNHWVSLIKDFNNVSLTEEQQFLKFYEDEFFSEFEIIDEDSSSIPFENEQQVFLYKFLTFVSDKLKEEKNNDPVLLEIISETNELRSSIQNLNKNEVVKRISSIFARIKKFSLKLSMDIFDVAKKEIIKKCLYGGIDEISYFIDKF